MPSQGIHIEIHEEIEVEKVGADELELEEVETKVKEAPHIVNSKVKELTPLHVSETKVEEHEKQDNE